MTTDDKENTKIQKHWTNFLCVEMARTRDYLKYKQDASHVTINPQR
jgi:D-hexose-6-phosphate mutarotase